MNFHVSFEHMQEANDEINATTYYGGWVVINSDKEKNKVVYVSGNDRGGGFWDQVYAEFEKQLGRELQHEDLAKISDAYDEASGWNFEVDL